MNHEKDICNHFSSLHDIHIAGLRCAVRWGNGQFRTGDIHRKDAAGNRVLVAYFSCTGNTEGIAGHIVNILVADVYEIVPEEPYTDADLNYNDSSSRTTIEMNDSTSRPAISGSVENMEDYDIIFIGYPKMEYGFNCVLCV